MGFPVGLIALGIPLFVGLLGIGLFILNQERRKAQYEYRGYERRRRVSFFEDSSVMCTICLNSMSDSDSVALNCGHRLHRGCLLELKKRKQNKCPICRADILY